jgi:hypothetical protein
MKWIDIKGWKGIYQINRLGNVRSLSRWRKAGTGKRLIPEKILKPSVFYHGKDYYLYFHFKNRDKNSRVAQHRLIAKYFIPNPKRKKLINHKNGIKHDNRICNIEWVTDKENCDHAIKIGTSPIGQDRTSSKLTNNDVIAIKKSGKGKAELSRMYGVSPSCIGMIFSGKNWKHIKV